MKNYIRYLLHVLWIQVFTSVTFTAVSQQTTTTRDCIANKPPLIKITNPIAGNPYTAGSNINFDAAASHIDGTISKVEFFNNGKKISTDINAPYRLSAMAVEAGDYVLTAKATDNKGACTISDTVKITVNGCTGNGNILAEGFTGIAGASVAELTSDPAFPNSPSVTASLTQFEYAEMGTYYGVRVRGYICAPVTGEYTFFVSGDDQVELWLSTNDNPANKTLLAYILSWTNPKQYDKFPSQKSAPVKLVKGVRYYIEALHKQYHSYNHLSVAWTLPGNVFEAPIHGSHLSSWTNPLNARQAGSGDFGKAMKDLDSQNNLNEKFTIAAFPNPFQNYFTLNTKSSSMKPLTVVITDITGKVVDRKLNMPANQRLQLGNQLSAGVYFLEVIQEEKRERLKFLKQ